MALKETILDRAQKFIQKGAFDKAIIEYRAALDVDPRDFSIRLKIGDLYTKLNKKPEAVKEYTEVARANSQRGFYLKAIAVYKQVLKVDDTILDVHYKLAELYAKQRLMADAISEYSHIVNIFEKKGKTSDVMELLKKMTEVDPENVGVRLKLADLYQKLAFEKDALEQYFWIFDKLVSQGKLDKAEKIYLNLYSMNPSEQRVLAGLAGLYRQKGDSDQFIRFSKGLLNLYRESGDSEQARIVCEEMLAVRPNEPEGLMYLGSIKAAEQDISRRADEEKLRIEAELLAKQDAEERARQEAELLERQEAELKAAREAQELAREDSERKARVEAEAKAAAEAELKAAEEARLKEEEETPLIGFPSVEAGAPVLEEEPLIAFPEHEIEISLEGFEDHETVETPSHEEAGVAAVSERYAGAVAPAEEAAPAAFEGEEPLVEIEIPGLDESELRFTPRSIVEETPFHVHEEAGVEVELDRAEVPLAPVEAPAPVEPIEEKGGAVPVEEGWPEQGISAEAVEPPSYEPEFEAVEAPEVHPQEPLISIEDLEFKEYVEPAPTPLEEFDLHFKEAATEAAALPPQMAEELKEEQEPVVILPHAEEEVSPEAEPTEAPQEVFEEKLVAESIETVQPPVAEVTEVSVAQAPEPSLHRPEAEEDLSAAFSELMEKMGEVHESVAPPQAPSVVEETVRVQEEAVSGPEDMIVESERGEAEGGEGKKEEYVDLTAELGMEEAIEDLTGSWEGAASRESFDEFKSGMGQQLSREDSETHFNLGIAYMEMELYSEAANEFKVAMKDPRLEFDCYIRLGHCAMAQADPSDAIVYYLKGLKIEGAAEQERKGMMYELALAYEAAGEGDEAAQLFRSIYEMDPGFREVGEKVRLSSIQEAGEIERPLIPLDDGLIEVELL